MLNPDKIIEIFRFVENNYDLRKLEYKGINFWPLIRKEIGLQYNLNNTQKYTIAKVESSFSYFIKFPFRVLKFIYYSIAIRKYLSLLQKCHAYFFVFPESLFKPEENGKKYSKYLDPYYETIRKKYECHRFTIDTDTSDYLHPVQSIDTTLFFKWYYLKRTLFLNRKKEEVEAGKIIHAFTELNALVQTKFGIQPFKESIISSFNTTLSYAHFFDVLLKKKEVKSIFFECFYDEVKMGLTASAAGLNSKTIEIQHGGAEDNVYVPYEKTIEYKILPTHLWCWSKSDELLIKEMNKNFNYLKPVKCGNMWLKKIRMNEVDLLPETQNALDLIKSVTKDTVLITLQNPLFLTDLFTKIIGTNQNSHFIVVPHPYNEKKEIEEFASSVKKYPNATFIYNTNVNLLFNHSKIQITHSSTSALEAVSFNLPTIICSDYGYDFFKKQIEESVIFFSKNIAEINSWINHPPVMNAAKKDEYLISTSEEDCLNQMALFLN